MKTYYVYIMGNKAPTLYTGVTNNLERRVLEHRRKLVPGFTTRYNIDRLVYYETFREVRSAINREKRVDSLLTVKRYFSLEGSRSLLCGNLRAGEAINLGAVKRLLMLKHAVDGVQKFAHDGGEG
jgi:putative endonuclease